MTQSRSTLDEARLKDSLKTLDDLDVRSALEIRQAREALDQVLDAYQQAEIPPLRSDDGAAQTRTGHARPAGQPAEPAAEPINPVVQFPRRQTASEPTVLAHEARVRRAAFESLSQPPPASQARVRSWSCMSLNGYTCWWALLAALTLPVQAVDPPASRRDADLLKKKDRADC